MRIKISDEKIKELQRSKEAKNVSIKAVSDLQRLVVEQLKRGIRNRKNFNNIVSGLLVLGVNKKYAGILANDSIILDELMTEENIKNIQELNDRLVINNNNLELTYY